MQREPLHYQLVHIAKQYERKLAVIDRTLGQRLTYGRTLAASLLLADKLKHFEDSFVGVMLPTSAIGGIATIALLIGGKIPVFVNYATGVQANVEFARKKCGFRTVLTAKALLERLKSPMLDGFVCVEDLLSSVTMLEKANAWLRTSRSAERILSGFPEPDIEKPAAVLFTAGSESEPKAVPLTHRNIIANLEALSRIYPFEPGDVMLASLPLFHVFGLTVNLWLPFRFGMTIVSYANSMDFKTICTIIREEQPTYLVGTPSLLRGYLHHSQPGDFTSLRLIVTGADKCPDLLREAYHEKHGLSVFEGYGTTETGPIISVNTPDRHRHGSVGFVLPNLALRVVRHDTAAECATGEIGRILVRGESVFSGYLNDVAATAQSIHNGWYDTGDMGYLDPDGFLWHVGRLRRFVKIGGEMVSLTRVEEVLARYLPADASCCAVPVPDAVKGNTIIAAVTRPIDQQGVLREMAKQLPALALPKRFVLLEDLPKMASGKTDVKRVGELLQATARGS
jgi:acyl-[acyl-carrier-protein]-phospholipid O-acyltransferase/long-chain-fatty-acid--[acyl-carrier-protein] ligase